MNLRILSLILVFFAGTVAAKEPETKALPGRSPLTKLTLLYVNSGNAIFNTERADALAKTFHELGYSVEFRSVPLARGRAEIASGKYDGEFVRIREYGDSNPDLVRVDEPLATIQFSAYAVKGAVVPCDVESLLKSNLRIDYQRGIYYFDQTFKGQRSARINAIDLPTQIIQRLVNKRSDVGLLDSMTGKSVVEQLKANTVSRICDLHESQLFLFLQRKHAALAVKLGPLFKRLKQDRPEVFNFLMRNIMQSQRSSC